MAFEVKIGTSQNWDPKEAILEAMDLANISTKKSPKVILFFSTIHYEKNQGFKQMLNQIYTKISKDTLLVGGSVAGFMNNSGVYTQGISLLAIYSDEIDIASGIGHDTKKAPKKAAKIVSEQIKNQGHLKDNFILNIYSAGSIPSFPGFKRENVIQSKVKANIALNLMPVSLTKLQKGIGRDAEYLNELVASFPQSEILSGSMIDDISCLRNYQFYKTNVFTNTTIALSIKTKLKSDTITKTGLVETGKRFKITKFNNDKTIILEINHKPAKQELLKILGWPESFLTNRLFDRVWYYPIAFKDKNGNIIPSVIPLVMGDYLLSTFPIEGNEMQILTTSGEKLINATNETIDYFKNKTNNPKFGLIASCGIRLLTLKSKEFVEHKKLLNYFGNAPFLLFFVAGEATYTRTQGLKYGNDTFNMTVFWE